MRLLASLCCAVRQHNIVLATSRRDGANPGRRLRKSRDKSSSVVAGHQAERHCVELGAREEREEPHGAGRFKGSSSKRKEESIGTGETLLKSGSRRQLLHAAAAMLVGAASEAIPRQAAALPLAPLGGFRATGEKVRLPVEEVMEVLRHDLEEGQYFVTGDLSPQIFEDDCRFKDPTNDIKGLSRYLKALTILFDAEYSGVKLLSIRVVDDYTIEAAWTLGGYLKFPWNPESSRLRGAPSGPSARTRGSLPCRTSNGASRRRRPSWRASRPPLRRGQSWSRGCPEVGRHVGSQRSSLVPSSSSFLYKRCIFFVDLQSACGVVERLLRE
mmetsp:Transcript_34542/g.88372  ORF Transcript_34542/g.88372 Transcript_34542/m.88372 type:complete len:328 (+) Transcript_34542:254-1237(+)